MVDPTTANTSMSVPLRGTDVGTWDVPVNGNFNILDQMFGGVTTVALTSAPVTLTSSQAWNNIIRLTGTLNANVAITLPGIYKFWTVDNQLTNSPSSFAATFVSTSGASIIGLPPGPQDVFYDGTNLNYRNLGRVGEYWDYAGSTVPSWVTLSTKPPYLNCNGGTFSSAAYPILTSLLGSTTLPDSRGGSRYALNQGTARLSSAGAGIDGNTVAARGGGNGITLGTSNIPTLTSVNAAQNITVSSTQTTYVIGTNAVVSPIAITATGGSNGVGLSIPSAVSVASLAQNNSISVTYTNGSPTNIGSLTPGYVGGITMIRAA